MARKIIHPKTEALLLLIHCLLLLPMQCVIVAFPFVCFGDFKRSLSGLRPGSSVARKHFL